MKVALLTFLCACLLQQSLAAQKLPSRLEILTANYERAIERETKPITAKYIEELGKLKLELTKTGDLQGAVEVDKTLKKLGVMEATLANTLTNNTWIYTNSSKGSKSRVVFKFDGTASLTGSSKETWKWKVIDDRKFEVTYSDGNGCIFEFKSLTDLSAKGKTKSDGSPRTIEIAKD